MQFFTSAPTAVVPLSPCGSTALCGQAVVPPLGSTTMSGFCYFRLFAEVRTVVSLLPWLGFFPRGSTAWGGGRGSTAHEEVPPPAPVRLFIGSVLGLRQYRGSVR